MRTISFTEKLLFRPYLLCSKPVKPEHYSVLPSHILRVLLTKYGKLKWCNSGIIMAIIFNSECDGFEWVETENCFDFMKEATLLMEKRQKSKLDRLFADEREISG